MSDFETIRGDRVCPVRCAFALLFSVALLGAESALAAGITCAGYTPPPASSIPEGPAAKVVGRSSPLQPGQGHVNVLVVFAQFENEAPNNNEVPSYASRLFSPDIPGSFTHFYNTKSHGQLLVRGTVLPLRYRSEHPASEYLALDAGGWGQYGRFAREILEQVDDDVDLRQFDNDGPDGIPDSGDDDGLVDYTFIDLRSVPSGFLRGGATGVAASD